MKLGAKHVEEPYIQLGMISTIVYFSYFIIIIPFTSILENTYIKLRESFTKTLS
jgi:ubiquinol-cytochrome c reductase cytochrome b subunit